MKEADLLREIADAISPESTFAELFEIQRQQQNRFREAGIIPSSFGPTALDGYTEKLVMMTIEEMVEMLRSLHYKEHRIVPTSVRSEYNAMIEWADVLKFLFIIAELRGWDPVQLAEAVKVKTLCAEGYIRERALMELGGEWVLWDIDDVLAAYTQYFCTLCHSITGRTLTPEQIDNTRSIGEQFGMGRKEWEETKHRVRSNGDVRLYKGVLSAIRAVQECKARGYNILLVTNRPLEEYPRMYADTVEWLVGKDIPFDALVFGSSKIRRIIRDHPDLLRRIVCAFDDHPAVIADYVAIGLNSVLVKGRENAHSEGVPISELPDYVRNNLPGPGRKHLDDATVSPDPNAGACKVGDSMSHACQPPAQDQ